MNQLQDFVLLAQNALANTSGESVYFESNPTDLTGAKNRGGIQTR